MGKIYEGITDLIGNTPMIKLNKIKQNNDLVADIIAKLEFFNPAGSIKDRIAMEMIEEAQTQGLLTKDSVIIEPTSGNTGIGLAAVAAAKGYKNIIVMPENMSKERIKLIKAYGSEIVLTPGKDGMRGAINKALEIAKNTPGAFIPSQFTNPANPACHRVSTGPEIWEDTNGEVDILVAGIGTGGTISGVGEYLKSKNKEIKLVGVEPESSPVISQGKAGEHNIQGIGAGFIPNTLNTEIYDEIITVTENEAFETAREVAKTEGILVGISSGAAISVAKKLASSHKNQGKKIVVIVPDAGERYMSTELFE